MLVWKAMPSITPMISTTLREAPLISFIVSTTRPTTSPPFMAICDASPASTPAWRALSAFWRTTVVSSSMLAAVCSSDDACSSVRCDRSVLPAAICCVAEAIESVPPRTSATMPDRLSCIFASACIIRPTSFFDMLTMREVRSPRAMRSNTSSASSTGRTIARFSITAAMKATTIPARIRAIDNRRMFSKRAWAASKLPFATFIWNFSSFSCAADIARWRSGSTSRARRRASSRLPATSACWSGVTPFSKKAWRVAASGVARVFSSSPWGNAE
ncbi:hypothetical protein D3C81_1109420 [compost metagenome]